MRFSQNGSVYVDPLFPGQTCVHKVSISQVLRRVMIYLEGVVGCCCPADGTCPPEGQSLNTWRWWGSVAVQLVGHELLEGVITKYLEVVGEFAVQLVGHELLEGDL